MLWVAVLGLLAVVILGGLFGSTAAVTEGFTAPRRTDIGRIQDGWTEEPGYERDLRFTETFTDIQGLGVATDFCRAVQRVGDPGSLQIACAVGRREGMDTLEYRSRTKREGFQFSRDDYWRRKGHRMDYCRIVRDEGTGEFYPTCAIAGPDGFKRVEERDTAPPTHIQQLLRAYEGARAWYRWIDDGEDVTGNTTWSPAGAPAVPDSLRPTVSRGLQFNRWPIASQQAGEPAPPMRDAIRWGEPTTLHLDRARSIRAVAFWIWWDSFPERRAGVVESSNEGGRKDRVWIGVEGGAPLLPAASSRPSAEPALEVSPAIALTELKGGVTEPYHLATPPPVQSHTDATGIWVFEIADGEQRILRLEGPAASAATGRWQHVVLTTTSNADWWPTWQLWLDGHMVAERKEGRQIPAELLTENRIGRGLRGCLMDFRVYDRPLLSEEIQSTRTWAQERLHPSP